MRTPLPVAAEPPKLNPGRSSGQTGGSGIRGLLESLAGNAANLRRQDETGPSEPPSIQSRDSVDLPQSRLGSGRRLRTPLPVPVPGGSEAPKVGGGEGRLERVRGLLQNPSSLEALSGSPLAKKLTDKAQQFQFIQDFLHNPEPFRLRRPEVETSSTPEEIESRKAEVRYQLKVMQSVAAVLTDELEELEEARPLAPADQAPSMAE
jgi:hypothetical protein